MPKQVAIILSDNLHAIGLRSLLHECFAANVVIYASFADLTDSDKDKSDLFITTDMTYLDNLSFFATIKEKTLILTQGQEKESNTNRIFTSDNEEDIIEKLDKHFKYSSVSDNANNLTQREISVLQLVAQGRINKEIAEELSISINTVLTHRKNITSKLGIKSVSGLSVYAIMNGIISPNK